MADGEMRSTCGETGGDLLPLATRDGVGVTQLDKLGRVVACHGVKKLKLLHVVRIACLDIVHPERNGLCLSREGRTDKPVVAVIEFHASGFLRIIVERSQILLARRRLQRWVLVCQLPRPVSWVEDHKPKLLALVGIGNGRVDLACAALGLAIYAIPETEVIDAP